ncbi:glycoside hydrolase family 72 protein [Panaeolus papilionaceus]|nr:glycoside hydrolase family 72 protein [Panaeolus papilionaceus]
MPLGLPGVFTLLTAFLVCTVQAIPKVTRAGRYLYDDSGKRFYIKGIAYQEQGEVIAGPDNDFLEPSTFIDPLALGNACKRDLPFLQELGVNTLRIYSVDSTLNHDDCMSTFSNAGIYVVIDLALPLNGSIDRLAPSWSTNLLNQYTTTIDVFSKYDNVLAYNVGNEVVIQNTTAVAPFVKAAARDIKAYLKSKKSDALVGYAAINGASNWREPLANFLSCDIDGKSSDATSIDLYGLNDYEWCGASTFQSSYARTTAAFENYNVVAYFSEFGCILSPPRLWTETQALFSSDMTSVWSGGIAFSYFPAQSAQGQFGMVTISADNTTVTTGEDFDRLKTQYSQVTFIDSPSQSSAGSGSYPSCPASSSTFLASDKLPQTPNNAACNCLKNALSCQFTPQTNNYTAIVGDLINVGCSLLGQSGGSCQDIGGDGQTGVYGRVSDCDPTIKLSYVMSQYYEANGRNVNACSFAGNGTVNTAAPATGTSAAVAAASSCIANPGATFVPSPAASSTGSTGGKGNTGGNGSNNTGGAVSLAGSSALLGMGVMSIVAVMGGLFTLT